jgi:PAS domain S-box-containing protein
LSLLALQMRKLFASESSTIYLLNPDEQTLTTPRYFLRPEVSGKIEKLIGRPIPAIHIPVREGGFFHKVLSSGRGTISTDPAEIKDWMAEFVETTFLPSLGRTAVQSLIPQIFKLLNIKSTIVVPLVSDGKAIGLLDTSSAETFTNDDLKRIENIARQLTAAIQRQRSLEKLHESENRLIMALSAAQMSVWEWNTQTNDIVWSPEFYAITGMDETTFDGVFEGYSDLLHPRDVERVRLAAEKAVSNSTMFAEEFRIIRPDGEVRWLANLGHAEYGHSGKHLRMIGTVQDITQRKQVEVERQALLEIMQGLASTRDLHELLELIHRSIGNVIYAENFFVVFHDKETGLFEEIYTVDKYDPPAPPSRLEKSITSYVFRTGEPLLLTQARFDELAAQREVELIGTNSASWLGAPLKTPAGTIGVIAVQDYENSNRYTERDRNFLASIAAQVALAIERKQADVELQQKNEDLELLNAVNNAVIGAQKLDKIMELLASELSRIFSVHGQAVSSTIYMLSPDRQSIVMQKYSFSQEIARSIEQLIGFALPAIQIPIKQGGYFHRTMVSGQSRITTDPQEIKDWIAEFVETRSMPTLAKPVIRRLIPKIYKLLNIRSTINVPLILEDEVIGFIDVSGPDQFTTSDLKRIETIGGQLTAAIQRQQANEKIRRSEKFLNSIQNALSASIAILNEKGTIVQVNSAWREFATENGFTQPDHGVGMNYLQICDSAVGPQAEEAASVAQAIRAVIAGHKVEARIEYPCHGPAVYRWFTLHITRFEDGEHIWAVLAHENITEQKLAEMTLAQSQARYQDIFDSSPISLWEEDYSLVKRRIDELIAEGVTDMAKYLLDHPREVVKLASRVKITDVNKASLELFHAKQKSELLKKLTEVWNANDLNQFQQEILGLMSPSRRFSWEGADRRLDGERLEVIVTGSIPSGYENSWSKVVVSISDITDRKRMEEAEHEQRALAIALRDTAETLTSTLDYGEVLDHILSAVGRVVPHDAATIMLIDGEYAHVVRSHGHDERLPMESVSGVKLLLASTTNLRTIVETGQTVIVHDTHSYPGWHRMMITDWLRSNVGAPILIHGKVIGFILLDSATVGFFTPIHAERLEAFANQAALAINNANILQRAQEEIAERRRAEEKLRVSEERFRQLADNIEEVFWMTDARTGQELYMSPASEKVWGYTSEYLKHEPNAFMNSIFPEDRPIVQRAMERERAGEKVEMEYRVTRPDGSLRWVWDRAFPICDEQGQVTILAGIAADITERKQAVEALRESENKANALLNALPDLMFRMNREGKILSYKAESADLYTPSDSLINRQLRDVAPEEFTDLIERYIRLTLESGEMQVFEYQLPIPGRGLLDYEARMVTSGINEVTAIVRDITERKKAEDALRESEERFSNAFEFAPIGIALVSLEGKWLKVNHSLCDLLGYTHQELAIRTFQELTHPDDVDADLNYVRRIIAGEIVSYQMEKRYIHKSGETVWVQLSVSLVQDSQGQPRHFISQIQDISQRKRAEDEISRRAEETSALLATSMALTNLDLNAILQSIGSSAKTLFSADGCRIFLMQPDGDSLRCVLALQEDLVAFTDLRVRLGEGVTGAVAVSGQAEIVNTMQNDPRAIQVPGTGEEEEAIMFAPLKERDRTIGVLSVRRAGSERPFEPADLEFLEAFASMAASAVSNARLFEETQRRLAELEALYENGLAVGQLLDPQQIGERIIETFARHLSWHHVAIRLVRAGTDELELIAFNQPNLNEEDRYQIEQRFNTMIRKVGEGMSGWVVQSGQPIRSGNVQEHPNYVPTYQGILSGLYMPLRIGERVIGVISVESEQADALTAQDERLLATLANQAAIAFENARLYQAAHQEISERKRIERELRESQERYQLLVETSPDGVILLDMDGTIRFSNLQMAGLFHLENSAELVGTNILSLFAPEERQHIEQSMARHMFSDNPQEGHWLIRKDGSRFFGELRSSALQTEAGQQYAMIGQLRDVTERKQSQEALREERQRFLDLFENSPNPTWLEDFTAVIAWMDELRLQGITNLQKYLEANPSEYKVGVGLIRILNVNQAAVINNGARNKQELIDKVHGLMLDEAPSGVMIYELNMIWQGNTSFGFEMTSSRLNGTQITGIQRIYIPINNNRPDYARVIVTSTDITERVEMESRLRASELHYRELADSITDVLFELDHDLRYTHWNKASELLMGIPAYDAIGRSMFEIFGESEEQQRIGRIYQSVLEDNQARTFETQISLNGGKVVFEINANPSTRGVSVIARNITERKLAETLMQKRFELVEYSARHSFEEVLQKMIDVASELTGSHIGFMHFTEEDQTTINLQAWSTETLKTFCQIDMNDMHGPVEKAGIWADAIRYRRSTVHNDYQTVAGKKGLPERHGEVVREMVIPIIRNDKIVAVIGVGNKTQEYTQHDIETAERFADYAWDIAKRKQMESALAEERNQLAKRVEDRTADLSRANSNLARALRVKDEFLANMSHELRTPLNAILGLSESLGEQVAGPLNEKQQKYLATINESGHHLLSLINDILDLAKIEAGQITLDINKVDINSVCQASLRMIKQLAQKKNQEVLFQMDHDMGLMWADERRLKQMIVNLLSNAVKFTPESSRLGLEVRGDRAAKKIIITVWDTGIGIKEQDLERLFKPFVQLNSGLAREATGTGLGLALVAQMARLHGGSVHAISQLGEGSRFIIQLPWEPAIASDIVARLRNTGKFRAIDPDAARPTILLIEDTREVVMMLVDYLEMAGYNILTAQDGIEGLEQAKLNRPDLILMDIQMPRMDGFEATQKLRNDPEFKDIPIIALTALAMPNDRQRCLDAGMDEYMSKPVNLKMLAKTIHRLLLQSQEAGTA